MKVTFHYKPLTVKLPKWVAEAVTEFKKKKRPTKLDRELFDELLDEYAERECLYPTIESVTVVEFRKGRG